MEKSFARGHRHYTTSFRAVTRTGLIPVLISLTAISALLGACRPAGEWRIAEGAVWNTTYRIVYRGPRALDDSIQEVMNRVDMSLSPFNPSSLISRINRGETDRTDQLVDSAFAISARVSRAGHGRFDPTVAPLVNLWGFGYDAPARKNIESNPESFVLPQAMIDSALTMVGISSCRITNGVIHKKHPATTFNFSAVAKGMGCDLIAAMLKRNGCTDYMVEIGGEITVAGNNRHNKPWRIQIDTPAPTDTVSHTPLTFLSVTDCGVATSGNYRNFHNTSRYGRIGHTIDPVTGLPVATDVVSATVIAPTAGEADAWATSCMASTADSAMAVVNRIRGIECLLVTTRADTLCVLTSTAFPLESHRQ